ncbi:MAG: hypothetical protein Q7S70_00800 [bacterium]|nr:hypothetical protein [bacterium]
MIILPKNSQTIHWTSHSKQKMRYYRLSENRVKRVLRVPARVEEGIAPETIAAMQFSGTKKHPTEIWVMYVLFKKPRRIKIISTWRYPGITPKGQRPRIPEDILQELNLKDF